MHRYFQIFNEKEFFLAIWQAGLQEYDEIAGIGWEWQSADGCMTKSPLGGSENSCGAQIYFASSPAQ